MIARAAPFVATMLTLAFAPDPSGACSIRHGEEPVRHDVEVVGLVRGVESLETIHSRVYGSSDRLVRIETLRTIRGERRPEWLVVIRDAPLKGWRPLVLGEGPYRFAFDLPETTTQASALSPAPRANAVVLAPLIQNGPCGLPPVSPVSPYSPDVLLARAVGASAAPFVAGLSGLALLAGAAALLRRRRRRA